MFKPSSIRTFSAIAIALSVIGLLLSAIPVQDSPVVFFLGIVSWVILTWASILGYRLSSYKLYVEEYKKAGIRIYLIILAFVLFLFVGLIPGLVLSVYILGTLWGLKRNYDEWEPTDQALQTENSQE